METIDVYPVIGKLECACLNPLTILPQEDGGYLVTDEKTFIFEREMQRLPEGDDVVEVSILVGNKEIYFIIEFEDTKIKNMYIKSWLSNCGHKIIKY